MAVTWRRWWSEPTDLGAGLGVEELEVSFRVDSKAGSWGREWVRSLCIRAAQTSHSPRRASAPEPQPCLLPPGCLLEAPISGKDFDVTGPLDLLLPSTGDPQAQPVCHQRIPTSKMVPLPTKIRLGQRPRVPCWVWAQTEARSLEVSCKDDFPLRSQRNPTVMKAGSVL